jgi:hypothetical protein
LPVLLLLLSLLSSRAVPADSVFKSIIKINKKRGDLPSFWRGRRSWPRPFIVCQRINAEPFDFQRRGGGRRGPCGPRLARAIYLCREMRCCPSVHVRSLVCGFFYLSLSLSFESTGNIDYCRYYQFFPFHFSLSLFF